MLQKSALQSVLIVLKVLVETLFFLIVSLGCWDCEQKPEQVIVEYSEYKKEVRLQFFNSLFKLDLNCFLKSISKSCNKNLFTVYKYFHYQKCQTAKRNYY